MRRCEVILAIAVLLAIAGVGPAAAEGPPRAGTSNPQSIELPDGRLAGPSPDGTTIVGADGARGSLRLCVYDIPAMTEQVCGDLEPHRISLAVESVVWSPDSTRIAFAENAFQNLVDGDIWLMDATTGAITNVTDDGFQGPLPIFGPPDADDQDRPIHVDVLPAWSPDGRSLAFSRSTMLAGETRGNEIVRLDLATGEIERIVVVSFGVPGVVTFGLAWAPDGQRLYYSVAHPDLDDRGNGIWVFDEADGLASHLLGSDPEKGPPVLLRVAATGQTGLISYPLLMSQFSTEGEYFVLLDLDNNRVSPVNPEPRRSSFPDIVRSAAFSPDGTRVLYSLWRVEDGLTELWERDLAEDRPDLVAGGIEETVLPTTIGGGLVWADDGTIFVLTGLESAVLLRP